MKALRRLFQLNSHRAAALCGLALGGLLLAGCQTGGVESSGRSIDQLKAAANSGEKGAAIELGDAYFYGRGVPKNYAEAERWYKKATN